MEKDKKTMTAEERIDEIVRRWPDNQRTDDWHKQRLGFLTASTMGKYMTTSRTKGELFGATAKDSLYKIAGERMLSKEVLVNPDKWEEYEHQTSIWNKAIQYGVDHEDEARRTYEFLTGRTVRQCGSVEHSHIGYFSASPDGLSAEEEKVITWECKCPQPHTAVKYMAEIEDGETLKKANSDYYWQVQTQMLITGADAADFTVYCPFLAVPMRVVRVERNEDDIASIEERVKAANEFIEATIAGIMMKG